MVVVVGRGQGQGRKRSRLGQQVRGAVWAVGAGRGTTVLDPPMCPVVQPIENVNHVEFPAAFARRSSLDLIPLVPQQHVQPHRSADLVEGRMSNGTERGSCDRSKAEQAAEVSRRRE